MQADVCKNYRKLFFFYLSLKVFKKTFQQQKVSVRSKWQATLNDRFDLKCISFKNLNFVSRFKFYVLIMRYGNDKCTVGYFR